MVANVLSINDHRYKSGKEVGCQTRINICDTFDADVPHHFFSENELVRLLHQFEIQELKEVERKCAEDYNVFLHYDLIAQLT